MEFPLRYDSLFDEPTSNSEIQKIRHLKDKTREVVQSLWNAARSDDNFLDPIHSIDENHVKQQRKFTQSLSGRLKKSPKKPPRPHTSASLYVPPLISQSKPIEQPQDNGNLLSQEDEYYAKLQNFRRQHPDLCGPTLVRVDERLRPVKKDHPFKSLDDADVFEIENHAKLAKNQPPVKVSIPMAVMKESFQREYKPHRRNSFDPTDSLYIGDVL